MTTALETIAPPQLLLAESWDVPFDPSGWWLSEKLDGVRAYWDGESFWSRNGNQFFAPDWFTAELPDMPLDGELWGGRGNFARSMGIVRRKNGGTAWNLIQFYVFDAPSEAGAFEERMFEASLALARCKPRWAKEVQQERCEGIEHLRSEFSRVKSLGGEGLMLRAPGSLYEGRRSKTLVKVKELPQLFLREQQCEWK